MFKARILPWILLLVYLIAAAAFGIFPAVVVRGDVVAWLQARSADLVEIEGTLLESEVGMRTRGSSAHRFVDVRYAYEFNGREHIGTRLTFGMSQERGVPTSTIKAMLEDAEERGTIPVHVDRNEPSVAVLLPDRGGIITLVTVVVIVVPGAIVILLLWTVVSHVSRWVRGDHWWLREGSP